MFFLYIRFNLKLYYFCSWTYKTNFIITGIWISFKYLKSDKYNEQETKIKELLNGIG